MSLCCFWCHSQEDLFVNKSTGTIHCIGCKGFMSKILNRWNQPCKRVHRVKQPLESAAADVHFSSAPSKREVSK
jgi:hypothetical protein